MVKIPLRQKPAQKLRVVLSGQNCTITIYYRFGSTYLDLAVSNNVVIQGALCRNRAGIVQRANSLFSGSLHFVDQLGDSDPDYHLFNDRYILLYVPAGEDLPEGLRY